MVLKTNGLNPGFQPGIDGEAFSASRMSEDEFELKQPRMSEFE